MAITSAAEREALSRAHGRAALDQCKAMLAADMEHVRAAFWNRAPETLRCFVCYMAGLDRAKGKQALRSLDAADRAKIHSTIRHMLPHLENLLRCAQGGKTHDHGEMAAHCFNGIAGGVVQ